MIQAPELHRLRALVSPKLPPRDPYLLIITDSGWALNVEANKKMKQGYVPLGAPTAILVKPDPFSNSYYQWSQAMTLKS